MQIRDFFVKAGKVITDNSPTILTAVAVTGTVTTAYLTGKATFKAAEILREENRIRRFSDDDGRHFRGLNPKEMVQLTWKLYIPAATTGLLTVTCIIGANHIGSRRAAAVAAAYTLSERSFSEYRDKIIEKIGSKKEQEVRDDIAQDQVNRTSANQNQVVIIEGGSVLCFEAFTGRYFLSDMETLKKAQNDTNAQVINDSYASLGDFYDRVGLPGTDQSDEVGWNSDKLMEIIFSGTLTEAGKPCLVITFQVAPVRHYNRLS